MSKEVKKVKIRPGVLLSNPIVAVAVVALAVLAFILIRNSVRTGSDYYCDGVYINDVNMSVYTKNQGETMLNDWAETLLNTKYTLVYEDKSWDFVPKDMGASINTETVLKQAWNLGHTGTTQDKNSVKQSLRYNPEKFNTEFTFDEQKLDTYIDKIYNEVYVAPVDADILITATKPVVLSESKTGLELNAEELKTMLTDVMLNGGDTVINLPVETKQPAVSSDDAEYGLQLIVTYSTSLESSSSARCGNVKLALSNFNGFAVAPGEIVSFNEIVGERSAVRGYVEAPVYYGASVTTGIGGGVCQASSTLYGAVLKAGMDIIERNNHSLVVGYCEASMDAAVSEDAAQDFVFANNTEHTIYLYTEVINKEKATVYVYGARPEYRIELISTVLQNNIKNSSINTVKDTTGIYAYYTDEYVLKSEGKLGRKSMLERVYYDWDTGEEVKRETISNDYYTGERDTYYVGIHTVPTSEK